MALAFEVNDVRKSFGTNEALRGLTFSIRSGERVALIGPSGSGKTTLLRLIGTQISPSSGSVLVLGERPDTLRERSLRELRSRVAFVSQHLGLVSRLRVMQNVIAGRTGRRNMIQSLRDLLFPASADRRTIFELLQRVGIPEKLYDRTDSLSGGQQQRVALARALYQKPAVLLADEPVSSVDPARARSLLTLLVRLCSEEELTLVASIHQLDLAREFFPRLVGLKGGRILFDEASDGLDVVALEELFHFHERDII